MLLQAQYIACLLNFAFRRNSPHTRDATEITLRRVFGVVLLLHGSSLGLVAPTPPPTPPLPPPPPTAAVLPHRTRCTYLRLVTEDHFASGSSFTFGECLATDNRTISLANTEHVQEFVPGDELDLSLELVEPTSAPLQPRPTWARAGVHRVLSVHSRRRLDHRAWPRERGRGHRRSLAANTLSTIHGPRGVLTICMAYVGSALACDEAGVAELERQLWEESRSISGLVIVDRKKREGWRLRFGACILS